MLIHFAFGSLGKQGKTEDQTKQVIECILHEKRLLVSKCKEFIPAYPKKGTKRIPAEMFKETGDGEVRATIWSKEDPNLLNQLPDDTTIHYLPMDMPMICFTKMSFNQLKSLSHSAEYGKFGLVFTNNFLKTKGIKPVFYYTESSLWSDELIKRWNYRENTMPRAEKANLEREILSYRKPATLFPTFKESVIIKITRGPKESNVEYLTYDRYPENYDFTKEKEHRIVFDNGIDYLHFTEEDLFMVIVPDVKSRDDVANYLRQNWSKHPIIEVYPN